MNDTDKHLRDLWFSAMEAAHKASTALVPYSSSAPQVIKDSEETAFASIQFTEESHRRRNVFLVVLFILILLIIGLLILSKG
jgi:hypothetical protein